MAADTVPAAVPDPGEPATRAADGTPQGGAHSAPPRGLLASTLAAVEPARPAAFNLNPAAAEGVQTAEETVTEGASSDAYHGGPDTPENGRTSAGNTRQEKSVVRAWLLAGAERWKKGADARNKRLDIKKARAQALQVKETRTVAVNRSGGLLTPSGGKPSGGSGGSGASGGSGKSLNSKNSGGSSGAKGPKNGSGGSGLGGGNSSSGGRGTGNGSGSNGAGSSGGKGAGSSSNTGSKANRTDRGASPKQPKNNGSGSKGSSASDSGTSSKGAPKPNGTQHSTARETPFTKNDRKSADGKQQNPAPKDTPSTGNQPSGSSGTGPSLIKNGPSKDSKGGPGSTGTSGKHTNTGKAPSTEHKTGQETPFTKDTTPKKPFTSTEVNSDKKGAPGQDGKQNPGKNTKPTPEASKTDPAAKKNPASKTPDNKPGNKDPQGKPRPPADPSAQKQKPSPLQESRETGYRDGTRAAKAVAHVQAYRDGIKDGWTDQQQAAAREKTRLDQAHADRKTAREEDKPVPTAASSADHHPPQQHTEPKPLTVRGVTATHVYLGDDAAKPHLTRGEVRTLKGFERHLEEKASALTKAAERTKMLKAHAEQQAAKATELLEGSRSDKVKGGEKVTAALAKLQEAAKIQVAKAEETHIRAVRGAEKARATLSNAKTRYSPLYQAVVDSPETSPAEAAFYLGDRNG
jgi:hypothetical protein